MLARWVACDGAVCRHQGKAASQLGVGAQLTPGQSPGWGKEGKVTEALVIPLARYLSSATLDRHRGRGQSKGSLASGPAAAVV